MIQDIKTLAIKAKLTNDLRKLLYKKTTDEKKVLYLKKFNYILLTEKEQLKLFAQIFELIQETNSKLRNYKSKRRYKAKIKIERELRGWIKKKKTSLKEFERSKISF